VAALTEGQSPSSHQTAQPKPRNSIWLQLCRAAQSPRLCDEKVFKGNHRRGSQFAEGTPRLACSDYRALRAVWRKIATCATLVLVKLVVLGSGTSIFHTQRTSAGFWVETETATLLLDCGTDAPHRAAAENLDLVNLDAIWISHLHLDHCAGLAPLLFGIKWMGGVEKRKKPLKIFGCEGIQNGLRAIDESHRAKLFEQPFAIEFHEFAAGDGRRELPILEGLSLKTISTPHRPESLALRLEDSKGVSLVYSSDTGYSQSLAEFAADVDLLVLECSFYRDKPSAKHLELAEAIRIAQQARPKMLLLAHLYPEWDGVDLNVEAREMWSGRTIAAYDGLRLEI
jgi:ribonuclease BN (tRNA processing enzyme)